MRIKRVTALAYLHQLEEQKIKNQVAQPSLAQLKNILKISMFKVPSLSKIFKYSAHQIQHFPSKFKVPI